MAKERSTLELLKYFEEEEGEHYVLSFVYLIMKVCTSHVIFCFEAFIKYLIVHDYNNNGYILGC
jgi:hypothetical protein